MSYLSLLPRKSGLVLGDRGKCLLEYEGEPVDDVEDKEENWKWLQKEFVDPERIKMFVDPERIKMVV